MEIPSKQDFDTYYTDTYVRYKSDVVLCVGSVEMDPFYGVRIIRNGNPEAVSARELFDNIESIDPEYGYIDWDDLHVHYVTLNPARQYRRGFTLLRLNIKPELPGMPTGRVLRALLNPTSTPPEKAWLEVDAGDFYGKALNKQFSIEIEPGKMYPTLHYKGFTLGEMPSPHSVKLRKEKYTHYLKFLNKFYNGEVICKC